MCVCVVRSRDSASYFWCEYDVVGSGWVLLRCIFDCVCGRVVSLLLALCGGSSLIGMEVWLGNCVWVSVCSYDVYVCLDMCC